MNERIRLHLDEQVNTQISRALRQHGCDVTTTHEEQLAYARATGRVIVTHDADFLWLASRNADHAGIAYCAPQARTISEIIRGLIFIRELLALEDMAGSIEYL